MKRKQYLKRNICFYITVCINNPCSLQVHNIYNFANFIWFAKLCVLANQNIVHRKIQRNKKRKKTKQNLCVLKRDGWRDGDFLIH